MSLLDFCLKIKTEIDFYDGVENLEKIAFGENSSNKEISEYEPGHYDSLLNSKLEILSEEIIFYS